VRGAGRSDRLPGDQQPHRIAFVSDAVWPFNKGGKEKRIYEVSQRLSDYGRDVHIYTMQWWDGPKVIERDGVTFHAISALHPLYAGNRRSLFQALLFGVAVLKLLFEPFDILEVDAIPYFPTFSARVVCTLRRRKLVTTWHEVWGREYWDEYLGSAGFIGSFAERLAISSADHIVSVSEHTRGRLGETGSTPPTSVLLNGVDLELLEHSQASGPSSDVLFAGRLLANKNVDILIRSIALARQRLPEIRCLIVGEGPEREPLVALVEELGLEANVTFLDFVADLYGLMKASKVFVLPSVREGFGLVVVEANACGLPVITTRHLNNAARVLIIEGENGFLIDPDEAELAEKIEMALGEDRKWDPRRVAIENGLAIDWSSTARSVDALFVEVAAGRTPLPSTNDRRAL
jgi:glycosyltransferase involved in cell wall biosynthesis